MYKLKSTTLLSLVAGSMLFTASCTRDPLSPGLEYMPDMYRGVGPETYGENLNYANNMSAQKPAANTIARGYMPYAYANTPEGYEAAGANLSSPLTVNAAVEAEGKAIYDKMCIHCHGAKGDGQGTVKIKGDLFPVPSYYDAGHLPLSDGKMFHSITFGKGLMGSHASQLNQEERWKIIAYINKMQRDFGGEAAAPAAADSTAKTTEKK